MNLTIGQIKKAISSSDYILCRDQNGFLHGINSKIMNTKKIKSSLENRGKDGLTIWIGWKPCTFMEYINYKDPFILPPVL